MSNHSEQFPEINVDPIMPQKQMNPQISIRVLRAALIGNNVQISITNAISEIHKALSGSRVAILLLVPDKQVLKVFASAGYPQSVNNVEIPINAENTGWVLDHQKTLRFNQFSSKRKTGQSHTATVIVVPISNKSATYGVLIVENDSENSITSNDEEIFSIFGGVFGIMLSNSELAQKIDKAENQTILRSGIVSRIRSYQEKQEILDSASMEIGNALNADKVEIKIDSDDQNIKLNDLSSTFNSTLVNNLEKFTITTPISLNQKNIGLIIVDRAKPWEYDEQHFIDEIASQISSVINSVLISDERKKASLRDKIVADITNKIWSSQAIDLILQTSIKEIGSTLGADEAIIKLD